MSPFTIESLNQIYFLRMLLTDPDTVIPPGKSLISMLTNAKFDVPQENTILHSVTQVAHRAFWNEALDSLSSPLPSVQLPRLSRLYLDLHEALVPLFPPFHPILVSLSSPLPPTSSPLHSTLSFLKEILFALRQRCAPVRDPTIDTLLASFSSPSPLPQFVVDMIKEIISLADQMKSDLSTFVIGSMTDSQLLDLLSNDVKSRERDLVLKIWGAKDVVRLSWRAWLDNPLDTPDYDKWISRLFHALFSDKPVSCRLPTTTPSESTQSFAQHELPPQLFFSAPLLLDLQNHLQAIIIAAALRSLVRLPANHPPQSFSNSDFMNRIWILLKSEINTSDNTKDHDDTDRTKIINLADEVVRATQLSFTSGKLNTNEEETLRLAVERILRPNDLVFLLLKKRLKDYLGKLWLSSSSSSVVLNGSTATTRRPIPEKMMTGIGPRGQETSISEKRLQLVASESLSEPPPSSSSHRTEAERMVIPGFEDVVLRKVIGETVRKLGDCIEWVGSVWGDLL
ncbi:hypothetical protein BYT27DRAFT_7101663 [Phlegmacium glaucopus]|nr:hypothetical protein BYT27DRAFT_7101663 [Phlegmacium glaucopus]